MSRARPKARSLAPKRPRGNARKATRRAGKVAEAKVADADAVSQAEPMSQVTLKMRQSQHQELLRMAFEEGTTMRGIIMQALEARGLTVADDDLVDRRRR